MGEKFVWITEYQELMFGFEHSEEKTVQGIQIKNENMPEIFYKYRGVSKYTLDALEKDVLYFSAISLFNDPFECAMSLSFEQVQHLTYNRIITELKSFLKPGFSLTKDDVTPLEALRSQLMLGIPKEDEKSFETMFKWTDELIKAIKVKTSKEISQIGDEIYRVCSFSELNDSLLMWAHYANNHQGFCIGYNFKELHNDLTDLILPVIYSDELLEISKFLLPESNQSLLMNAITRKSKAWEYEKEWRMLMHQVNNEKTQLQKLPIPKSIYLGAKISEADKRDIINISLKKNINVYQMYMGIDEFKLYYKKV